MIELEKESRDFMYGAAMELDCVNYEISFQHGALWLAARIMEEVVRDAVKIDEGYNFDVYGLSVDEFKEIIDRLIGEQEKGEE